MPPCRGEQGCPANRHCPPRALLTDTSVLRPARLALWLLAINQLIITTHIPALPSNKLQRGPGGPELNRCGKAGRGAALRGWQHCWALQHPPSMSFAVTGGGSGWEAATLLSYTSNPAETAPVLPEPREGDFWLGGKRRCYLSCPCSTSAAHPRARQESTGSAADGGSRTPGERGRGTGCQAAGAFSWGGCGQGAP